MKIKTVCENTGLTDRAVRFYIEKGLLQPESTEIGGRTYYEYGEADVALLQVVMTLRKAGFSIEEILRMQKRPEEIGEVLEKHNRELQESAENIEEVLRQLEYIRKKYPEGCADIYELAEEIEFVKEKSPAISAYKPEEIRLNFGKLDKETEEEKEQMYQEFLGHQYVRNKIGNKVDRLGEILHVKLLIKLMKIALAVFCLWLVVGTIAVLIPRKVSSFFVWDETKEYHVAAGVMGYNAEINAFDSYTYSLRDNDEGYEELEKLLSEYKCYGFVNTLFPTDGTANGAAVLMLDMVISNDEGDWDWYAIRVHSNGDLVLHKDGKDYRWYLKHKGEKDDLFQDIIALMEEYGEKLE